MPRVPFKTIQERKESTMKENNTNSQFTEEELEAARLYYREKQREWRAKNREKEKENQLRYAIRKGMAMKAAKEGGT